MRLAVASCQIWHWSEISSVKIALKKLSRSDLTFLEPKFRLLGAGNQKSINLNADVFVDELFPDVTEAARELDNEIPIKLTIYGPGYAPEYKLARKIVKGAAYKNWRLNGEFVRDPDSEPGRFDDLSPGDLALMAFEGQASPSSLRLVFLAGKNWKDKAVLAALAPFLGARSMVPLEPNELLKITSAHPEHPVSAILTPESFTADLEEAAFGNVEAATRLWLQSGPRKVSAADLAKSRTRAEEIGLAGEEVIQRWLLKEQASGAVADVEWSARANAVSPYDFTYNQDGAPVLVDVKTTTGAFERSFHLSFAELRTAATASSPYLIFRLYGLNDQGALLRRSLDISSFAAGVLKQLDALPHTVTPDSFTIDPAALDWLPPVLLQVQSDDD
jgi:hypothetical protein